VSQANGEVKKEMHVPAATIVCLGVSYRASEVGLRERLLMLPDGWLEGSTGACPFVAEYALLATCNRWELYAVTAGQAGKALPHLRRLLHSASGIEDESLDDQLYYLVGEAAARHLCQVAAGLDSMVLGEAQILGQVTDAYSSALSAGTVGPALSSLFRTAIRAGKRARTSTSVGAGSASLSAVAIAKAEAIAGNLVNKRILVVGAGEMVQLALKGLLRRGAAAVTVANRTAANASSLLLDERWRAVGLFALMDELRASDIVLCATGAPHLLITTEMMSAVCDSGQGPSLLLDLAVPRDIDPAIRKLAGVTLLDIDELQEELDQGLVTRLSAVPDVERIVDEELGRWELEQRELTLRPLVVELRQRAEEIRLREVDRTLRFLGDVDDSTVHHINHLTRALVNKLLHQPTVGIRSLSQSNDAYDHAETIRALFGLTSPADHPHHNGDRSH
jgi:glutamyl-tRNA reductase